ncbi:uncharacterized protein PITG_01546 [Phytophthora infestans T30-4]|uniref:Uncharacterized protein n=1 Tax=Phytophthora infestans (strain T30-4) TaxID=403677 RepID=D0MTH9_PHYIT|nr:uncharacterized protein PITG_01546 [Phytophthora infestans T30-4]EEY61277.1 conserved hypothetical protein [Phytophthora infestans T30-4]|eukprot:XP_002908194.1 conserved hypothetical protein [Phytophthora infestans T30-4]
MPTTATSATTPATPTLVTVVPEPAPSSSRILSPATLRVTPTPLKHKRPDAEYVSPIKKMKKTMQHQKRRIIDSIDDLRNFIQNNDVTNSDIRESFQIQAHLLWTVNEYIHGLRFLRLYLGEQRAPESLHEQQTEYQQAQRDDLFHANQFLITLSLYDIAADNPSIPSLGSIIVFVPTKLRLYRHCCQVETKVYHIGTVTPP